MPLGSAVSHRYAVATAAHTSLRGRPALLPACCLAAWVVVGGGGLFRPYRSSPSDRQPETDGQKWLSLGGVEQPQTFREGGLAEHRLVRREGDRGSVFVAAPYLQSDIKTIVQG